MPDDFADLYRTLGRIEQKVDSGAEDTRRIEIKVDRLTDRAGASERSAAERFRRLDGQTTAVSAEVEALKHRQDTVERPLRQAAADQAARRRRVTRFVTWGAGTLTVIAAVAKPVYDVTAAYLFRKWLGWGG